MGKIAILGVVIGKEQVQMEEEKIKAVKEQKTLTKSRKQKVSWDLQTFTEGLSRISAIQQNP